MSEQQHEPGKFPANWQINEDYDPSERMMKLGKGEYLNVQNRMLWFVKDQRAFIAAGLASVPYVIRTELVEIDRQAGFAHFRTYVRDVLGNEATMYGSETAKDFPDYAEKASTKSLGRALLMLGYGTANAQELDEGGRVVDSPQERRQQPQQPQRPAQIAPRPQAQQPARVAPAPRPVAAPSPAPAPQAPSSAPAGNYNALADAEVRKAAAAVGYNTVPQFETFMDEATGGDRANATRAQLLAYAEQLKASRKRAS